MVGEIVSHYRVLKKLGEGGMGEVYLAQDTVLGRKVALKFLPQAMEQDPLARKRFLQEAKAAASLDHPYICHIHEIGEAEGKGFIAMEYVAGENLQQRLDKAPLPAEEALRLAVEIAEALEVAHDRNFVHRDLKPANIMLTRQGHAKVMDFGLAKELLPADSEGGQETLTAVTQPGTILGTIAYMSPEQARGESVDPRSDIFSFGVLLYEMVSGQHPFKRPSSLDTMSSILRDPPPPLEKGVTKPLAGLERVMARALSKDRSQRYQKTQDLVNDLRDLREQVTRRHKRVLWPRLAAAVLLMLAALTGLWSWMRQQSASPGPEGAQKMVSVLVADFQNSTGDAVFDHVLEEAMVLGLEGAPFITSYDRGRAHRVAEQIRADGSALDPSMARLVAQREGISVIVTGSIARQGQTYQISVKALDALTGKDIVSEERDAGAKEDVLGAVGKLAARTRTALGDTSLESAQLAGMETFTAGSLEAAQNYAQGQEVQGTGNWEKAIPYYTRAVEIDPGFGRAYAGLAVMNRNLGRSEEAVKYYRLAMANIDRMADREKYRTRGGYYVTVHNYPKAIEEFGTLVAQYPADLVGHNNLALAYFLGRRMSRAVEEGRRAVEIYPRNVVIRNNLALYSMYAADFTAAAAEAARVLELNPSYEGAYLCRALSQLGLRQPAKAIATYRQLQSVSLLGSSLASGGLADLALAEGRLSEATTILERSIVEDKSQNDTEAAARKSVTLASAYLVDRQMRRAVGEADSAVSTAKTEHVLFAAGRIYLEAGLQDKALKLAAELGDRLQLEPRAYGKLIQGEAELERGDVQTAIKLFQEAQALADTWLGRFDLGRAYLRAGAFTEAHSEFEICLKRQGEAVAVFLDDYPTYRYLPPVYYYLGLTQEALRSPAALESYRTYVAMRGESSDPLVDDARRRLASYGK